MSPTTRTVDARGLPCPQPVILARKALAEGGFQVLEVLVDDPASCENLQKFAAFSRCPVETLPEADGSTRLRFLPEPGGEALALPEAPAPAAPGGAPVILIAAEGLGQGDPELGRLLMRGFLYTLTEAEVPPRAVLFMNGGVRLTVADSPVLAHLQALEARGTRIQSCGTCLEFLGLTPALAVGGVTNMYDIATQLLQGPALTFG